MKWILRVCLVCAALALLAGCSQSDEPALVTPTAIPTISFAPLQRAAGAPTLIGDVQPSIAAPTAAAAPVMEMMSPTATMATELAEQIAPVSPLPPPAIDASPELANSDAAPLSPVATPVAEMQVDLPIVTTEQVTHTYVMTPSAALTDTAPLTESAELTSPPVVTNTAALTSAAVFTGVPVAGERITSTTEITVAQGVSITLLETISVTKAATTSAILTPSIPITTSGALTVNVGDPAVRVVDWQWQQSALADGAIITPARPVDYTMQVHPDGAMRVQADCNVGEGWWSVTDDELLEIAISYSLDECSPESLFALFTAQLNAATSFELAGDTLTITTGPAGDVMTFMAAPPQPDEDEARLTWAEIGNAAYPVELGKMDVVTLTAHEYRQRAPSENASELVVGLTDWRAHGDLDGDGAEDAAVIASIDAGGSVILSYLYPVLNREGHPVVQAPVFLGDQIFVRNMALDDGVLTLDLDIPGEDADACCPTDSRRQTYAWQDEELTLLQEEKLATPTAPAQLDRGAIGIELVGSAEQVVIPDIIEFSAIHSYIITATAGQIMTVTISSPDDSVYLSMYGMDDPFVLRSVRQERASWAGEIPVTQPYMISAVSVGERTSYTLTIGVGSVGGKGAGEQGFRRGAASFLPAAHRVTPHSQTDRFLYLTFDDGPTPPFTTDVLAQHDARGVFLTIDERQLQ